MTVEAVPPNIVSLVHLFLDTVHRVITSKQSKCKRFLYYEIFS